MSTFHIFTSTSISIHSIFIPPFIWLPSHPGVFSHSSLIRRIASHPSILSTGLSPSLRHSVYLHTYTLLTVRASCIADCICDVRRCRVLLSVSLCLSLSFLILSLSDDRRGSYLTSLISLCCLLHPFPSFTPPSPFRLQPILLVLFPPPGPSISVLIDSIRVSLTRALPSLPFLPLFIHQGFATALLDLFAPSFLGPPCMTLPTPPQ